MLNSVIQMDEKKYVQMKCINLKFRPKYFTLSVQNIYFQCTPELPVTMNECSKLKHITAESQRICICVRLYYIYGDYTY